VAQTQNFPLHDARKMMFTIGRGRHMTQLDLCHTLAVIVRETK